MTTRFELIQHNKKLYAQQKKIAESLPEGLEKEVKIWYVLPWLKGYKWCGGLSPRDGNRAVEALIALGYTEQEQDEEFNRQIDALS